MFRLEKDARVNRIIKRKIVGKTGSKMMIKTTEVKVGKDYRCPFCPDHRDCNYVIWEGLLDTPICGGCDQELKISFVQMPEHAIWRHHDMAILRELTGKSYVDLQLIFALNSLEYYRDTKNLEYKINYYSDKMDEEEKKIFIRQEKRYWMEGTRHAKKLIRKILKLEKTIPEGETDMDILEKWANSGRSWFEIENRINR